MAKTDIAVLQYLRYDADVGNPRTNFWVGKEDQVPGFEAALGDWFPCRILVLGLARQLFANRVEAGDHQTRTVHAHPRDPTAAVGRTKIGPSRRNHLLDIAAAQCFTLTF